MSPSQLDLDQGGPQQAVLPITTGGAVSVLRGTNLVTVNFNGSVTLNLPSAKASPQSPQAIPGQWVLLPITVVDVGGFAGTNPITINPFGAELISGLASVSLASPYGSIILKPILETGGWTLLQ